MIKNIILDILFPKVCVGCGREGKYICDKCKVFISECESLREVRPLENFNDEVARGRTSTKLDGLTSIWDYEGLIKELIQMIKYQGITDIIKELISLIDIKVYYPYITYVPMYLKKEKQRGFNQAELIAKELAKKSEARLDSARQARPLCLLEKIVDTEDQAKLSKEERLENVRGCFRLSQAWLEVQPQARLETILLVDDVFTTGATINECCKVLKQSGVKKVWGFTLARTP